MKCLPTVLLIHVLFFAIALQAQTTVIEGTITNYAEKTLPIYNIATEQLIGQMPLQSDGTFRQALKIVQPMEVRIGESNSGTAMLIPGKTLRFHPNNGKQKLNPANIADSLHNALHTTFNQFLSATSGLFFVHGTPAQVWQAVDSFRQVRARQIDAQRALLSEDEFRILQHRNAATLYAFALSYGRTMKPIPAADTYYDFIEQINPGDSMYRFSPIAMLYRLEIAYFREHEDIVSTEDFVDYITSQVPDAELAHLYKAVYLKERLDAPSNWRTHPTLTPEALGELEIRLATEKNPYQNLYYHHATIFYQTHRGQKVPDFQALDANGNPVKLSDFQGKTIVIDTWATWCGPCLDQKPTLLSKLAELESEGELQLLFVSVDQNKAQWEKFIAEDEIPAFAKHLYLPKGFRSDFAVQLSINTIPRYIIIDADGNFVNAEAPSPGAELQEQVRRVLNP